MSSQIDKATGQEALTGTQHHLMMHEALRIAENCKNIQWYGVGCIITDSQGTIISTGYTGELLENEKMRHAEDIAISKALESGKCLKVAGMVLYSTLEPCSIRASGSTPCCQHIIDSGIKTVIYGAKEPYDKALEIICQGDAVLKGAGIQVIFLKEFEERCLKSVVSKRLQPINYI
jgi:pyrimidine deaminase RibD-like protein